MKNAAFQMVMLTEPAGGTKYIFASFMHFKMQNMSANDNLKRGVFLVNFILIKKPTCHYNWENMAFAL